MNYISAQINDYYADDRSIHCAVCDNEGMTGVSVTFDSGFMRDVDMCMDCLKEVLAFKERVTDPQIKAAQRGGSAEDYQQPVDVEPVDVEPVDVEPVDVEPVDTEPESTEAAEETAEPAEAAEPEFPPAPVAQAPEPASSGYGWIPPSNETPRTEELEAQEAELDDEVAEAQSQEFEAPPFQSSEELQFDEPQQSELDSP